MYAQKCFQACMTCAIHNAGKTTLMMQTAYPPPSRPFGHLMIDFIELTSSEGKKYCLVMVNM